MRKQKGVAHDQHFIADMDAAAGLVDAAELTRDDIVLEAGAGDGRLTKLIARRAGHVIAAEMDRKLINRLKRSVSGYGNVEIINANALDLIAETDFDKLVSNPPYGILEAMITRLAAKDFLLAVMSVPEGFAETVTARPGHAYYSRLSFFTQTFFDVRILFTVPASAWEPPPDVESAVISLKHKKSAGQMDDVLKEVLLQKDKKLGNALREAFIRACGMTKNETREIISSLHIDDSILDSKIQSLNLSELTEMKSILSSGKPNKC